MSFKLGKDKRKICCFKRKQKNIVQGIFFEDARSKFSPYMRALFYKMTGVRRDDFLESRAEEEFDATNQRLLTTNREYLMKVTVEKTKDDFDEETRMAMESGMKLVEEERKEEHQIEAFEPEEERKSS